MTERKKIDGFYIYNVKYNMQKLYAFYCLKLTIFSTPLEIWTISINKKSKWKKKQTVDLCTIFKDIPFMNFFLKDRWIEKIDKSEQLVRYVPVLEKKRIAV